MYCAFVGRNADVVIYAKGKALYRWDKLAWRIVDLGSGLIDHIQKMTMAAMAIADMKVWAQRS
jgi:hypothetical protein